MTTFISLRLAEDAPFEARRVEIQLALNTPFVARVEVVSEDPRVDLDRLIGVAATLAVGGGDAAPQLFTGVVRRARMIALSEGGAGGRALSRYAVEVAPKLWVLGQQRDQRVHQVVSDVDLALDILGAWKIPVDVRLDRAAYPRREVRVQYGESDLAFASRLLEEAGVTTWFEARGGESTLVLDDAPHAREPSITLPFHDDGIDHPGAYATRVAITRRLRPGRYTVKDLDLRKSPEQQPVATAEAAGANAVERRLERFHYLPGAFHVEAPGAGGDTPVADERLATRADVAAGEALVARRLEAKRVGHRLLTLDANEPSLLPGVTFVVLDHASRELGARRPWLVTRARLTADVLGGVRVAVEAASASSPYRPPLATPRPVAESVETATTIAREGEEIDPNELGAVRLHYPWERTRSVGGAWATVSQPWAGRGFGKINLPRHGQEVLVEHLVGNPDQPVVVGRVYNALQPVPYKLPAAKTQSGWRSSSTQQTGGYNEFMMEDAGGDELMRMQAERDLSTETRRDEERSVENDRTATIGRDDTRRVKRDQTLAVGGNVTKFVGGTSDSSVGASSTSVVGQSFRGDVTDNRREFTSAGTTTIIGGDDLLAVDGTHDMTCSERQGFKVGGSSIEMNSGTIIMKTAAGAVATFTPAKLELKCDIFDVTATELLDAHAATATYAFDTIALTGHATAALAGAMVTLNGGGKPFSRLLDDAPAKLANGAALVTVGK